MGIDDGMVRELLDTAMKEEMNVWQPLGNWSLGTASFRLNISDVHARWTTAAADCGAAWITTTKTSGIFYGVKISGLTQPSLLLNELSREKHNEKLRIPFVYAPRSLNLTVTESDYVVHYILCPVFVF